MRSRSLAFALAFASALVVAGCVTPAPVSPTQGAPSADMQALAAKLRALPAPALDGAGNLAWLQSFVTSFHPRVSGTPSEKDAGDALAAQLKKLGYAVEEHKYGAQGAPSVDGPERAIVGVKKGTKEPDRLIIVGGHYDTAPAGRAIVDPVPVGTPPLEATYDNGSGTAMVMELARLLANFTSDRTIMFVFFNGEEELGTSGAYVQELISKSAKVDAYLGFDMVGIAYPAKNTCLCIYSGEKFAAEFNPLQTMVVRDVLHYPIENGSVEIYDNHKLRNSDEASFQAKGYPTMRWAGGRLATDYWAYHKTNDTMDTMVAQAGGREPLVKGFEATAASAYYTVLALDQRAAAPA